MDRSTILCLYVPGFQRQVFKHVKIFSEKGSVVVAESAYSAQIEQFGLVMPVFFSRMFIMIKSKSSRMPRNPKQRVNESDTDYEKEIIVKTSFKKENCGLVVREKRLHKLSAFGEAWGGTNFTARNNLIPGEVLI